MRGHLLNSLDTVSLLDLALALVEKGRRILPYKTEECPTEGGFATRFATVYGR